MAWRWLPAWHHGEKSGSVATVGIYGEHVVPRIINLACGMEVNDKLRRRVCEGLSGHVVEIGFGSGLNVPFYPSAVDRVDAVEPADLGWKLAAKRVGASPIAVRRSGLDGQLLPFADASHDFAISTWTLCTIPDAVAALREVRRVLKPGGALRFVEHGLAPDDDVQRWQRRIEPVQKRLLGGCHLTRPVARMLETAGFSITELDVFYEPGAPKALGAMSLGSATAGTIA